MITGVSVRAKVGDFEVLRSPFITIESRRRQIVGRAVIEIPDTDGKMRLTLRIGDKAQIILRYRGDILEQTWEGTIESIFTKADNLIIQAVGLEKILLDTIIKDSFYGEPANVVATRLLSQTGFHVAGVDIGDHILPYQVFSSVPLSRVIKQLEQSISRSFNADMTKHALWLDANKSWHWKDGDENGEIFILETAKNLISHKPPQKEGEMGEIVCALLPSLTHSRKIRIRDKTRNIVELVRSQEVIHECKAYSNRTVIRYGKNEGWG